jgi:polyferredoxin
MYVNLFGAIPGRHPGASPSNYLSGSGQSLLWSVEHGGATLAIHTVLGVLLGVMVIGIVARSIRSRRQSVWMWSIFSALMVIGAGFNGASFLDYNKNVSSFIMALLAFAGVACFVVVFFLISVPGRAPEPMKAEKIPA